MLVSLGLHLGWIWFWISMSLDLVFCVQLLIWRGCWQLEIVYVVWTDLLPFSNFLYTWVERFSNVIFINGFKRDWFRRICFENYLSANFSSSLCIWVFNWITFDLASKFFFNLSLLILLVFSYHLFVPCWWIINV